MPPRSPFTYAAPDPFADLLDGLPVEATYTITATTDLPARLYGGNAQAVEVSGLDYTLHLDLQKLPESEAPTSNDGKWTVVWDEPNNIYKRVEFTSLPGGVGPSSTYIGDQPPNEPTEGQLWWESDSGQMFIWYTDANSSQWVPATIQPSNVMGGVGTLGNVYDTIHIARLTIVPAELKTITLSGYNQPGDSGPAMPCRRTSGPVTAHAGWFRTADRYTDTGIVDSTNGGYWEYVGTQQAIHIGWFGAIGDYYIVPSVNVGDQNANINPTPTDNYLAIKHAWEFMTVYTGWKYDVGYPSDYNEIVGPTVQIGYGAYYCSETLTFDRTVVLQGMGHGYYKTGAQSRIIFAAGKKGIMLNNTRSNNVGPPENKISQSIIRNLYFHCLGHGGQTDKHGLHAESVFSCEHCTFNGFGGNGLNIEADFVVRTNANLFYLNHVAVIGNAGHGVYCVGGDANAGTGIALNCISNGGWGINDQSFLGNGWIFCHADANAGGAYRAPGGGGERTTFFMCYSESGQPPSLVGVPSQIIGGIHAANVTGDGLFIMDKTITGFNWVYNDASPATHKIAVSQYTEPNTFWKVTKTDGEYPIRFGYSDTFKAFRWGWGIYPDDNAAFAVTAEGYTNTHGRPSSVPPNNFLLPQGAFIGDGVFNEINSRLFQAIDRGSYPSGTGPAGRAYAQGDTLINIHQHGGHWGEACVTAGTIGGTPPVFKRFGPLMGALTTTVSDPIFNVAQTWNNAAVIFIGNSTSITDTASSASSVVEEWKVNGVQIGALRKDGVFLSNGVPVVMATEIDELRDTIDELRARIEALETPQ